MKDGLRVDRERTIADYVTLHQRLDAVIAAEAEMLKRLRPDAVLSNISYIALAAAARAGIPGIGVSVFTWVDILRGCCGDMPGMAGVMDEMIACYAQAEVLLQTTPSMPMTPLRNVHRVGPIAGRAERCPTLAQRLGAGQGTRVGLIGFGGFGLPLPLERWPRLDGWRWLTPDRVPGRDDLVLWSDLGLSFATLLASVDVMVTKPGYGTFAECAVAGTPVLTVPRQDWPESPFLVDWLRHNARCCEISLEGLFDDRLAQQLQTLFSLPAKPLPVATGIREAADAVLERLTRRVDNTLGS